MPNGLLSPARQTAIRGLLIALTAVITLTLTFVLGRIVLLDGFWPP